MGKNIFEKIRASRKMLSLIFICLFLFPILAQGALQLAGYSFAYSPAKPLNNPTHLSRGLKSFGFVSGVGGVAFGAIAKPYGDYKIIKLKYDDSKPDGERLLVTIKEGNKDAETVIAPIADWVMIPIARFAQDNRHAIFTLFGQLQSKEDEIKWFKEKARVLNYHPAVANTLAGMRLFQADILAFHEASIDLPKFNGEYLLGTGEQIPDVSANIIAKKIISEAYVKGGPQSYVICDENQSITFSVTQSIQGDRQLFIDGYPYWASWKLSKDMDEIALDFVNNYFEEHQAEMKEMIINRALDRGVQDEQALNPIIKEVQETYAEKAMADKTKFNKYVDENNYLVNMDDFSRDFSDKMRELKGGNPTVYDALTTSMRYAAFFRFVKKHNPKQYDAFVKSIAEVSIQPYVKTPTVLIPPRMQE